MVKTRLSARTSSEYSSPGLKDRFCPRTELVSVISDLDSIWSLGSLAYYPCLNVGATRDSLLWPFPISQEWWCVCIERTYMWSQIPGAVLSIVPLGPETGLCKTKPV